MVFLQLSACMKEKICVELSRTIPSMATGQNYMVAMAVEPHGSSGVTASSRPGPAFAMPTLS
jgi:hypothetical protein